MGPWYLARWFGSGSISHQLRSIRASWLGDPHGIGEGALLCLWSKVRGRERAETCSERGELLAKKPAKARASGFGCLVDGQQSRSCSSLLSSSLPPAGDGPFSCFSRIA